MARHDVVVVGGGNAGISLAARLRRLGCRDVAVVAPRPEHRYRPLLNYVAGGQAEMRELTRPTSSVIPDGCTWLPHRAVAVHAAVAVLRANGSPMQTKAMVAEMRDKELWTTAAPTPAATLYSAILREMKTKGAASRFKKTGRGHFGLNA